MQEHVPQDDTHDSLVMEADEQHPMRRIIKRERRQDGEPTPLAVVITGQGRQPKHPVTVAQWSEVAFSHLKSLAEAFKQEHPKVSIPVVSLRGRFELADQDTLRLDRDVG